MHDHDLALDGRLAAMEARGPATAQPPVLPDARKRGRFAVPLAMAPVLVVALVATAAAGTAVVANLAHGYPGIQNPGQPMAGVQDRHRFVVTDRDVDLRHQACQRVLRPAVRRAVTGARSTWSSRRAA